MKYGRWQRNRSARRWNHRGVTMKRWVDWDMMQRQGCGKLLWADISCCSRSKHSPPATARLTLPWYAAHSLVVCKSLKGFRAYGFSWETRIRTTECQLPYGITHCYLHASQHGWLHSVITPARQASTWFTYPRGMEGWVDLGVGYIPRWFTSPVTHPSILRVVTAWYCSDRESNQRPDRKSNILPLHKQATLSTFSCASGCIKG